MKSITLFFGKMNTGKIIMLSVLCPVLATLLSMKDVLIGLSFIILLDMFTGIRKSLHEKGIKFDLRKIEFWHSVKSSGIRSTWRKTYEYVIGILAFVALDGFVLKTSSFKILGEQYSISEIAVITAIIIEVYSIFENMEAVSGRNPLKRVISILPNKFKTFFSSTKQNK